MSARLRLVPGAPAAAPVWGTRRFAAWSCTVRLAVADARVGGAAEADLRDLLGRVDAVASRFRADSALSRANRHAGRPVPVPRDLVELVGLALDAARDTDGACDPTVGRALVELGYDRDIDAVRGRDVPAAPSAPCPAAGWRAVGLDRTVGLLTVPPGAALDLGATAKAATADRAARLLHARHGVAVLVEIGGDVALAGRPPGRPGWSLAVAEAPGASAQRVLVAGGGVATSTTTVRAWRRGGHPVHHVVDPRTGRPVDGPWRTVTVAAASALAANTASTAALVLGADAADWLATRGLAARLVDRDGAVHTVGGWPAGTTAAVEVA